ncbi:MAG: PPK2 family polyphosphate kinase [Solirubrobacteraceae bacterium]
MAKSLRERLRVPPGPVSLTNIDTRATPGARGGKAAAAASREEVGRELADLQERLWAEATVEGSRRRVLLVLQGMDTSGKDGAIKRGLGGMNSKWLRITGFGPPTEEERGHQFLWRIRRALPGPGEIGVFDRSHYEDVVAVRARELEPETVWRPRIDEINAFERALAADGTAIVKVFLHISRDYQLERQLRRLDRPDKRWKFDESDIADREHWEAFEAAYAEVLERCNTPAAPWFVVPADRKWYRMWAVSQLLLETLRELDPQFPQRPDLDVPVLRARLQAS